MKKKIFLLLLISILFLTACGKKTKTEENNSNIPDNNGSNTVQEIKKVNIVDLESNTRPYAVVINNFPGAVKVQTGLNDAYMIYEMPVEGGMSRSLALFKDKYPTKLGTVRSARHNFLDYVLENDALFVHFGYSHYAQDDIPKLGINNINGLSDSPFWRENPEGLAYEHTAYTSLEQVREVSKNKGYRMTTDVKPLLSYSTDEIDLSIDGIVANSVFVPYSSYYNVKFVYDAENKVYQRYVNNVLHKDYFTGELFTAKNIIVVRFDFVNATDNYYLDFYNVGSGEGYYITDGFAKKITWEKSSRTAKTIYKYLDGTEIKVNDGNTYIMMQSASKDTIFE